MAHLRDGITITRMAQSTRRHSTQEHQGQRQPALSARRNVGGTERLLSVMLGTGLLLRSMDRLPSFTGALGTMIGAALVQRGASGQCPVYTALSHET